MPEQKPEKKQREKLPMNFMTDEFMDQQLTTLNKLNKEKKNANDGNAPSTKKHLEGDSGATEDSDSKQREESSNAKSSAEGSWKSVEINTYARVV